MDNKKLKSENTKLVIAISSRALFNLDQSHKIFKEKGIEAYAKHQQENEHVILEPGVGFTLVKKLLKLNSKKTPIDVILLSRNSADTGLRIFNSIEHYDLNISRAAFTRGESTHPFVGAFEADLFLSSNYNDVQKALQSGYAAASIVESKSNNSHPSQLRIAFDGDADRLGVVTKDGQVIFPDRQMMLFAKDVLTRHPNGQIIYDVKCTRNLAPWIEQHGGQALMWKTGHSLVKAKLKETGAPLAGEMSGHIFFKDRWFGFDDGLYTGARLLEILSKVANPSEVLNALPNAICTPELQLPCAEGEAFILLDKIKANPQFPSSQSINTIDGVRVEYADGFGLARPSNTTPIVVLRFEADSDEAIQRIQGEFKKALLAVKPDAKLPF